MIPYQILEVANTHAGNIDYVFSLLEEFEEFNGYGIKFQPLHPDRIATKDFTWYPVYTQLVFDHAQWTSILKKAHTTKQVWLDLFDTYGTDVFQENIGLIKGIKLQPSILNNEAVVDALSSIGLERHILIINVSGLEGTEIRERVTYFTNRLRPAELWIEVGFQSYPTELQDCGFVKIAAIKREFPNTKLVFADHADAASEDTVWLPIFAAMTQQVDVIEKHICHSVRETKYDHFSSISKEKYTRYITALHAYLALLDKPFINDREKAYLANSIQIPIAKKQLEKGQLLHPLFDVDYKRSGLPGLNTLQIRAAQNDMHILSKAKNQGESFQREDFKKATIATIIAGRLKSTRLPRKALLRIGQITSVERCIQSCLRFKNANFTILASSDLADDAELREFTYSPSVIFHTGDPEDVIRRYLSVIDQYKIDVVIRVTADMPFVSSEIVDVLLQSHFEKGADYTAARNSAVGTSAEIINVSALRRVKEHFPNAQYSEYMTWYFQNNAEHFKINIVDLPSSLIRNYRLTLDYQEDLDMFNAIQNHFDQKKTPIEISKVFDFLDSNPEVGNMNAHLTLKYKTDPVLIATLNEATKIH